jgi:crossover junction endodeoxyribonuclease RuvC
MMRLLGLDPGLQRTGWGVIEVAGNRLCFVAAGVVTTDPEDDLALRLDALYRGLQAVVAGHAPAVAAVEETVINRNAGSSLKLGQARGVVLLAAAHAGLSVAEYASKTVKRAVVGTGAADKRQVAMMVRTLLPASGAVVGDAADALAVALCHAHHQKSRERLAVALAAAGPAR